MPDPVLRKEVTAYGQQVVMVCDGKCNKAWGINNRPRHFLSDEEDDYEYLADDELGEAPKDPGTYEGDQAKPSEPRTVLMNKWCFRECERVSWGKTDKELKLRDFSKRLSNRKES